MAKTIELRQQRARLVEQMRDFATRAEAATLAKNTTVAAEMNASFDLAEADERELSKTLDRETRLEQLEKDQAGRHIQDLEQRGQKPSGDRESEYRSAFHAWMRQHDLSPEQRSALAEMRGTATQVVGTPSLGGYLVPQGFLPQLEVAMKSYSGIFAAADIFRTESGNPLRIPTEDDTATSAVAVAEAAAFTVQDLTFGQVSMDAYKYGSLLKVSYESLQDSAFDIDAEMTRAFGPRFGRTMNTTCTTGSGSDAPNGVVTASTVGKVAASATAITFAEVMDLFHSVDPAYRSAPGTGFMMHDSILAAIKKIQLGSGDVTPLWLPSVRDSEPDKILGKPYFINQGMSSALTTGLKVMLFGDFKKYRIRLVKDLTVQRLNELYSANGLVGYLAWMRWDGDCVNTAAIKHLITA